MEQLSKQQLSNINGGVSISGTLINAVVKGINVFLDLGRSIGTAIRRVSSGKVCKVY
ncbi:MAG: bacteriocin [Bacilli bacterium]